MSPGDVHQDVFDADDGLASFATDLRAAADETPLPVVGDALARLFADGLAVAPTPAAVRARRRTLRRRVAIVLGAGVALTGGGLGVAGALPGPVQRAVSDVADVVGIDLPSPDDSDDTPAPPTTTPAPPATVQEAPATSAPPASAPAATSVPPTAPPADDEPTATTTPEGQPETPPSNPRADERPDPGPKRPDADAGEKQRAEEPSTDRLQRPDESEVDDEQPTRARAAERRLVTPPNAAQQRLEVDADDADHSTTVDDAPEAASEISPEHP